MALRRFMRMMMPRDWNIYLHEGVHHRFKKVHEDDDVEGMEDLPAWKCSSWL